MANINEVAKRAGVSKSTVSYTLSGKKYVSPEIRDRVRRVCDEIDYTASFFASNILSNKTNIIGLFFEPENKQFYPFYSDIIKTCILEFGRCNMQVIPYFGLSYSDIERLLKASAAPIMGAIVLTPKAIDNRISELGRDKIPFVLIGEPNIRPEKLVSVDIDNHELACRVFEYARETGHEKILFINSPYELMISKQRESIIKNLSGLHVTVRYAENIENAAYVILTDEYEIDTYDCIIVASDINAKDVYRYCEECELKVGHDISVISFGGDNYGAFRPKLTGAVQNYNRITRTAIKLLCNIIGSEEYSGEQVLVRSEFFEGESVRKRNKANSKRSNK